MDGKYLTLARRRARELGLSGKIDFSDKPGKKLVYREKDIEVHFGSDEHEDFLIHKDPERRRLYRKRARGIMRSDGRRAIDVWPSAAWLSYRVTW